MYVYIHIGRATSLEAPNCYPCASAFPEGAATGG